MEELAGEGLWLFALLTGDSWQLILYVRIFLLSFFRWCAGVRGVNGLERFINTAQNTNKGAIERPQIWVFYEIVSDIGWKIAANTFFCVLLISVIFQHFSIFRVFGASLLLATLLWIMEELAGERFASLPPSPKKQIFVSPSLYLYIYKVLGPQPPNNILVNPFKKR